VPGSRVGIAAHISDDSAAVREVLRLALESECCQVLEAAGGREGVRLFRDHRPAIVIADIVMPEKAGLETVNEILAINHAAVIFTMTRRDMDHEDTERLLGARMGCEKPIQVENLLSAVMET